MHVIFTKTVPIHTTKMKTSLYELTVQIRIDIGGGQITNMKYSLTVHFTQYI